MPYGCKAIGGSGSGTPSCALGDMEDAVVSDGRWVAVSPGLRSGSMASCASRCVRGDWARRRCDRGEPARERGEDTRDGERSQYLVSAGVRSCVCTWVECAAQTAPSPPPQRNHHHHHDQQQRQQQQPQPTVRNAAVSHFAHTNTSVHSTYNMHAATAAQPCGDPQEPHTTATQTESGQPDRQTDGSDRARLASTPVGATHRVRPSAP